MSEKQISVLVVEDNHDSQVLARYVLKLAGFDVVAVGGGATALRVLAAYRPDVIVTDLRMPRMSGVELIKAVRADATACNIPVVALTAYAEELGEASLEAGADVLLEKPEGSLRLAEAVSGLLAGSP